MKAIDVRKKYYPEINVLFKNGYVDTDRWGAWVLKRQLKDYVKIEEKGRTKRRVKLSDPTIHLKDVKHARWRFKIRLIID